MAITQTLCRRRHRGRNPQMSDDFLPFAAACNTYMLFREKGNQGKKPAGLERAAARAVSRPASMSASWLVSLP